MGGHCDLRRARRIQRRHLAVPLRDPHRQTVLGHPGVTLASRVSGFGRTMAYLVRHVEFQPPLLIFYKSGRLVESSPSSAT